jgi:hypothetical protein
MNPTCADLRPIPRELWPARDRFRVIDYDLVRYVEHYSESRARAVRHPVEDYQFGLHKISRIEPDTGKVLIKSDPFFTSYQRIEAPD